MKTSKAMAARARRKSVGKPQSYRDVFKPMRGLLTVLPDIDLTKPIYEQILKLEAKDRKRKKR